ncbi:MAG TPA: DUF2785 domain-containing protein [Anaerolineales bacterium]|nr:DUF2785 domain-containing protein [Anaerolineales bacterium]
MDKEFWVSLAENDYKIPESHTLEELTETLFGYLGSTDPEMRDDIAYLVYANFLKREMYAQDEIREHINKLLNNLDNGIGETNTDSVFLRTFSVLLLAEIVYNDNKKPLLDKAQVETILSKALSYLEAEQDPRGHVPVKGWAHALAHTADLLQELGKSRFVNKDDFENILNGIANKLVHSTNWVYIHGEDERLANAVAAILQRDVVSIEFLQNWLKSLKEPEKSWKGAYMDEGQAKAFHNVRNFLRSVSESIRSSEDLPRRKEVEASVLEALDDLKPY